MSAKTNLAVDGAALLAYLAVANPAIAGISVHEWASLGLLLVLLVHLAMHVDWAARALSGFAAASPARKGRLVLDTLILVSLAAVGVSGIMVSGSVLGALGLYASGYFFWDPLHAVSAKVLLALIVVHVALHVPKLFGCIKKGKGDRNGIGG